MQTFIAKCGCGCCEEELQFVDEASGQRAFEAAGLDSSATIVDDAGVSYSNIDTFYGFWSKDQEPEGRGLGYLVERVFGKA